MDKLSSLIEHVRFNCELASVRQAGMYSVCGLAMRLRDLYKWEHGLMPWEEGDAKDVLQWIGQKEEFWDQIYNMPFKPIALKGITYDPFDTGPINQRLAADCLYYGAGMGEGTIPSFFLGTVVKNAWVEGLNVIIVEKEYARDLMTNPAFSKDQEIVIRKASALYYLWNSVMFARKENQRVFQICFREFGVDTWDLEAIKNVLNALLEKHLDVFIYHEIGELKDNTMESQKFHLILDRFQRTIVEFLLRAIKDLLSDTHEKGRFPWLVGKRDLSGLALSIALLDDFRRILYSDICNALELIQGNNGWDSFSEAISKSREKAKKILLPILEIIEDVSLSSDEVLERIKKFISSEIKCNSQNLHN
jgi:hypothetical protein